MSGLLVPALVTLLIALLCYRQADAYARWERADALAGDVLDRGERRVPAGRSSRPGGSLTPVHSPPPSASLAKPGNYRWRDSGGSVTMYDHADLLTGLDAA